jgi:hypothetical protein
MKGMGLKRLELEQELVQQ